MILLIMNFYDNHHLPESKYHRPGRSWWRFPTAGTQAGSRMRSECVHDDDDDNDDDNDDDDQDGFGGDNDEYGKYDYENKKINVPGI